MTIAKTGNRVSYIGDGVSTAFAFEYRFFDDTDLGVYVWDGATLIKKVLITDYTVINNGDETGGTVTLPVPLAIGSTIAINSEIPQTQETDYTATDAFPAETHEAALDKLTRLSQQSNERADRTLTIPVNDSATTNIPYVRANSYLYFDATRNVTVKSDVVVTERPVGTFETAAAVLADIEKTYTEGMAETVVEGDYFTTLEEGFSYKVAASAAVDYHAITAGGVKLYVQQGANGYNIKAFGAVGDSVADDLPAILAAVAAVRAAKGGEIHFPNGTYKVTGEILIDSPSVRFTGTGRRKVYPKLFVPSTDGPPTIMPVHSGTAAVRFFSNTINTASTFSAEGINFATLQAGSMPTCCFGFDGSGNFHRDYTFNRVGIHGFTSAFDTYGTGGVTSKGLIKIINCAINLNKYIARTLTGTWNGFVFEKNEAGQNLKGGIDIAAHAASIRQNSLEDQPNPVRIIGNYRGVVVAENYFEANNGAYCVQLENTLNAVVEGNFWQNILSTEPLRLIHDIGTTVNDRIIPSCLGSFDLRSSEMAIDPVPTGNASVAVFLEPAMITNNNPLGFTEFGSNYVTAPAGTLYGIPNSAGKSYTSTGSGVVSNTKTGLSIAQDSYIAACFAITYVDVPVIQPEFDLRVNSLSSQGFINPQFYSFHRATTSLKGRTVLYFGIVKALAPVTSFQLFMYPFGVNPAAGLVCRISGYALWDMGTSIPGRGNIGNPVRVFIPETKVQRVTTAPISGTWPTGYKLYARAPVAGGYEGWICTAGGTPGTWKTFGVIAP